MQLNIIDFYRHNQPKCNLTGDPKVILTITSGTFAGLGVGVHILSPTSYSINATTGEHWSFDFGIYYPSVYYQYLKFDANHTGGSNFSTIVKWATANTQKYTNSYSGGTYKVKNRLFFMSVVLSGCTMTVERACNWDSNPP